MSAENKLLPPMPPMVDRRTYDEELHEGCLEGNRDWAYNNNDAVEGLANNHVAIREALNTRAAQPVAVEGMPERMPKPKCSEMPTDTDAINHHVWKEHCQLYDAFTAWLSKAAQGLPEPVGYIQDRHGQHLILKRFLDADNFPEFWDAVIRLDAVTPLVAQLRAENERLCESLTLEQDATAKWQEASIEIHNGKAEVYAERNALRAENERLKKELLKGVL